VGRFPARFAVEICRNGYRYFYKHFGKKGATQWRRVLLLHCRVRLIGYGLLSMIRPNEALNRRLDMYRVTIQWNKLVDPVKFVESGQEPQIEQAVSLQAR
jgi:hypothetical protein